MDRALASAAAALALAALSLALQAFKLEALGQAMTAAEAGGEGGLVRLPMELVRFPLGETPWAQRLLQVRAYTSVGVSRLRPYCAHAPVSGRGHGFATLCRSSPF